MTENQIHDLTGIARFIKAVNFPTEHWQGQSDGIRARLENQLVEIRRTQLAGGLSAVTSSDSFAECLHAVRSNLEMSIDDLSAATGIPRPLLEGVESSKTSPVRVPVEKMTELLLRLHMAFNQTVDLVRASAENWALETFTQGQTQLGRVGRDLPHSERREILEASGSQDVDSDIERELQRVDEYTEVLRQRIQSVLTKT